MSTRSRRRSTPLLAVGILGVAIAAVLVLAFALSDNIVYFKTTSEAIESREDDAGSRIRMAGTVVPGSITETADGAEFELIEDGMVATVHHQGSTPDLFEECAPLVVEGRWATGAAASEPTFDSDRILIRHDNEYRAPDDDLPDCPE